MSTEEPQSKLDVSRRTALQLLGVGSLATAAACSRAGGSGGGGKGGSGSTTYSSWYPFSAPPAGNYHTLGGVTSSIPDAIGYLGDYMVLPGAIYYWKAQKYFYLLADDSSNLSADGKTFTYKVRSGMKWSDGSKITAKDVYTTWLCRYVIRSPVFDYVDSFEQTDDMTVTFHIGTPAPISQYYLLREHIVADSVYGTYAKRAEPMAKAKTSQSDKKMVALNKTLAAFTPKTILASGPFKPDLDNLTGQQLTMVKNDNCYFADKVHFDKVIDYASFDFNAIVPLILQKKLDYTTGGPTPAEEKSVVKAGLRIIRSPIYSGPALYFNYAKLPEFADKRVRQALCYAVDHAQNGRVSLGQSGKEIKLYAGISDAQVPTWISAADQAKFIKYTYDQKKATTLLEAAGWKKVGAVWHTPQGKPAEYELLFPSDYGDWSAASDNLASQFKDFGIKITLHGEQSTQVQVDVQQSKFTLAVQSWGSSSNPFPADSFRTALFNLNTPTLAPTSKGMDFPMKQKTDVVGEVDLQKTVIDSGLGATPDALKAATTTAALAFNELLPVIPLWERYGNSPMLQSHIKGYPPDGDPIYENSIYADNYTTFLTFQGVLKPA
ncbi:MAG TPA: ABC transporter substrate-binding protein [Mycobacteriales bacterium]|nr:ABC transporter substrate-binding protein [Mycobacteriales bacterium]